MKGFGEEFQIVAQRKPNNGVRLPGPCKQISKGRAVQVIVIIVVDVVIDVSTTSTTTSFVVVVVVIDTMHSCI